MELIRTEYKRGILKNGEYLFLNVANVKEANSQEETWSLKDGSTVTICKPLKNKSNIKVTQIKSHGLQNISMSGEKEAKILHIKNLKVNEIDTREIEECFSIIR